jgi:hypothetical protein
MQATHRRTTLENMWALLSDKADGEPEPAENWEPPGGNAMEGRRVIRR